MVKPVRIENELSLPVAQDDFEHMYSKILETDAFPPSVGPSVLRNMLQYYVGKDRAREERICTNSIVLIQAWTYLYRKRSTAFPLIKTDKTEVEEEQSFLKTVEKDQGLGLVRLIS